MRTSRLAVFLVCLGIFLTCVGLIIDFSRSSTYVIYSGDVTFNTVWEYTAFKDYLIDSDVVIEDIQILASEPPIWVRYRVEVPRLWEFPFTYDLMEVSITGSLIGYVIFAFIGSAGILLALIWVPSED